MRNLLCRFLLFSVSLAHAFVQQPRLSTRSVVCGVSSPPHPICRSRIVLRAKDDDESTTPFESSSTTTPPEPSVSIASPTVVEQEPAGTATQYPVNLPSPLLLATSMIAAIAATGSTFELMGGDPKLGLAMTAAIAVVGFPVCAFFFYAAVLKATAETEEDDRQFLAKK